MLFVACSCCIATAALDFCHSCVIVATTLRSKWIMCCYLELTVVFQTYLPLNAIAKPP